MCRLLLGCVQACLHFHPVTLLYYVVSSRCAIAVHLYGHIIVLRRFLYVCYCGTSIRAHYCITLFRLGVLLRYIYTIAVHLYYCGTSVRAHYCITSFPLGVLLWYIYTVTLLYCVVSSRCAIAVHLYAHIIVLRRFL